MEKAKTEKGARWIFSSLDSATASSVAAKPRKYVSGETHFYLGRRYRLKVPLDIALAGDLVECRRPGDTADESWRPSVKNEQRQPSSARAEFAA